MAKSGTVKEEFFSCGKRRAVAARKIEGSNPSLRSKMTCLPCELKKNKRVVLKTKYTTIIVDHNQFYQGRLFAIFNRHIESEHDMTKEEICNFILDCMKAGAATEKATKALRVNYVWLNNKDPHVHMHIIPRHKTDPEPNHNPYRHNIKRIADEKELDELYKKIMKII